MSTPSNHVHSVTCDDHAKAVEDTLRALQDSHRLAIHMVETDLPVFGVHHETIADFNAVPSAKIADSLQENEPSLFSMTLLPSTASAFSIGPYKVLDCQTNNYGYLFNLSQQQNVPPRVVRADPKSLVSDPEILRPRRKHKLLKLQRPSLPALEAIYEPYREENEAVWEQNLLYAVGGTQGSELTEKQLDILGQHYMEAKNLDQRKPESVANYNEILVAASTNHIAAIVVPYYTFNREGVRASSYGENVRLQAAITGLDHLSHGIQLPVTVYHVDGKNKGRVTYLGQEKEELKKIALESLKNILLLGKRSDIFLSSNSQEYADAIEKHLGIKLYEYENKNEEWLEQIEQKLDLIKATQTASSRLHQTSPASGGRC